MTIRFSHDSDPDFSNRPPLVDARCEEMGPETLPDVTTTAAEQEIGTHPSIFVPEYYEENYAYPLVVWIERGGNAAYGLERVMPVISERNYFGMSFVLEATESSSETRLDSADLCEALHEQIRQLRQQYHIHTERIFLAGFDEGATCALELGLAHPEWFAGMACLAGSFPRVPRPLHRFRDLRGKRVLLGAGLSDRKVPVSEAVRTSRLLHAAGLKVCTRFHDAGHQITRSMLTEIDRWIMHEIYHPQPVS